MASPANRGGGGTWTQTDASERALRAFRTFHREAVYSLDRLPISQVIIA